MRRRLRQWVDDLEALALLAALRHDLHDARDTHADLELQLGVRLDPFDLEAHLLAVDDRLAALTAVLDKVTAALVLITDRLT